LGIGKEEEPCQMQTREGVEEASWGIVKEQQGQTFQ